MENQYFHFDDFTQTNTVETEESGGSESSIFSIDFRGMFSQFLNPQGLTMLGLFLGLLVLSVFLKGKGKLTSGRFVGVTEKMKATSLANKQMKNGKCQPTTLWSGTPKYWFGQKWLAPLQVMLGSLPSVWFPNAERGILVLGAPGSGKTFSVIDRAVESGLQQGASLLLFDKKGDQIKLHAPSAVRYGYDVQVLAPGESYSGVINPLDFLRDPQDSVMAEQIGKVIVQNAGGGDKGNEFFQTAGQMLAKGLVQLAKASRYPDLAMVYAFIRLPNFVERIYHSANRPEGHPLKMDKWIIASFSQLLSSKDAEKTVAGIKATAEMTYSAFIQKELLRCFIGPSTIPVKLVGKQAIFFKMDDRTRDVIGPLLATAIHLCIISNLREKRANPLIYCLDEFPALKLEQIVYWVNEYRSNGGIPILGIQSLNQLRDRYGENKAKAIAAALSTHVLFYPGDFETAEQYSKRYGETEVTIKNRSTSRSTGHNSSRSVSHSPQIHKKPLISPDEILRFPQGKCVITSPAYGSGDEALYPYKLKIPVSKADIKRAQASENLWPNVRSQLEKRAQYHCQDSNLDQELERRIEEAQRMLPLPNQQDEPVVQGQGGGDALKTETINRYRENINRMEIGG